MISTNLDLTICLSFLFGSMSPAIVGAGYPYMCEFLTPKHMIMVAALYNMIDGATNVFGTAYFVYISKNYIWLEAVGFVMTVVCAMGLFWVPESVPWLLKSGKIEKAKSIVEFKICKLNGLEFNPKWLEEEAAKVKVEIDPE